MEYLLAVLVVVGFGYFLYRRSVAAKARRSTLTGTGGGGRQQNGNTKKK